jgi:hypothetical protein
MRVTPAAARKQELVGTIPRIGAVFCKRRTEVLGRDAKMRSWPNQKMDLRTLADRSMAVEFVVRDPVACFLHTPCTCGAYASVERGV